MTAFRHAACAALLILSHLAPASAQAPAVLDRPIQVYAPPAADGDGEPGDQFGAGIAREGATIAIAAPSDRVGGETALGSVYVFAADPSPRLVQKLRGPAGFGYFGHSIALENGILAVARSGGGGSESPAIYVYERDASAAFVLRQTIVGEPLHAGTGFADKIVLSGGVLAVGDARDGASVYERDANGLFVHRHRQQIYPDNPDATVGRVVLDGNRLYIGGVSRIASAVRTETGWADTGLLVQDPTGTAGFGLWLAVAGEHLYASNTFAQTGSGPGRLYRFAAEPDGGHRYIDAVARPTTAPTGTFGFSLAAASTSVYVLQQQQDALHLYTHENGPMQWAGTLRPHTLFGGTRFSAFGIDGPALLVGANDADGYGRVARIEGSLAFPSIVSVFSNGRGASFRGFGTEVVHDGDLVVASGRSFREPLSLLRIVDRRLVAAGTLPVGDGLVAGDAYLVALAVEGDRLAVLRHKTGNDHDLRIYRIGPNGGVLEASFALGQLFFPTLDAAPGVVGVVAQQGLLTFHDGAAGWSAQPVTALPTTRSRFVAFRDASTAAISGSGGCALYVRTPSGWIFDTTIATATRCRDEVAWRGNVLTARTQTIGQVAWFTPSPNYVEAGWLDVPGSRLDEFRIDDGRLLVVDARAGAGVTTYRYAGGGWEPERRIVHASEPTSSAASAGELVFVGYPQADGTGVFSNQDEGEVRVFDLGALFDDGFE